jgi:transketolase
MTPKTKLAMGNNRNVYGQTLLDMMQEGKPVVVVEADLMRAAGTAPVFEQYPERAFNIGVAEQNAVGVAAGMADMGLIPFFDTFAVLLCRRAVDQVWMAACFNRKNVKLNGMESGFTTGTNGVTHQALDDIAMLRSFPNLVILEPADCTELAQAVRAAAEYVGPVYLRNVRNELPVILREDEPPFRIGQAVELRSGSDVTIVASGIMAQYGLYAADVLADEGISARVVNPRTIKPLDEEMVLRCARETGAMVTVENHSITGGLGGAIAELLSENCPTPLKRVGVRNKFGNAGNFDYLIRLYEMDTPYIVAAAKEVLAKKK